MNEFQCPKCQEDTHVTPYFMDKTTFNCRRSKCGFKWIMFCDDAKMAQEATLEWIRMAGETQ